LASRNAMRITAVSSSRRMLAVGEWPLTAPVVRSTSQLASGVRGKAWRTITSQSLPAG